MRRVYARYSLRREGTRRPRDGVCASLFRQAFCNRVTAPRRPTVDTLVQSTRCAGQSNTSAGVFTRPCQSSLDDYRSCWHNPYQTRLNRVEDAMKLSTRTRYGTRALLDLALREDDGPISLKSIADRQGISLKYLERIFASLQRSGLVQGVRGAYGGYRLVGSPVQITLRRVYETLESPDSVVDCTAHPQACGRAETCVTQQVWSQLHSVCMETLDSTTLDDLVRRARQTGSQPGMHYS